MADINDLVQDFWRTSSDGADGEAYIAMRRLLEILQECFDIFEVSFDNISFCAAVDLADKYLKYPSLEPQVVDPEVRAKFKILLYGYQTMFEQSSSLVWADNFLAESHTCDSPEQEFPS